MTQATVTDPGRSRAARRASARDEIRDRYPNRTDDWLSPGDFSVRRRPIPVHAGDGAPVRWDPRRGAFRRKGSLLRGDIATWGLLLLAAAAAVFIGAARMQGLL